jgi:uncharacterized protein YjdB
MKRLTFVGVLLACGCFSGATELSAVNSISITSNVPSTGVFVGDQIQLNADALDINGNPVPVAVTYTSSNTTVATVSTTGLITALAAGSSTISVSAGGQTDHLTLQVDGNVSSSVQVMPPTATMTAGSQMTFTYVVLTALDDPGRNKSAVWSTSDATKATVDQTGLVTAVAATTGISICATATDAPSVVGCATVTIH